MINDYLRHTLYTYNLYLNDKNYKMHNILQNLEVKT